MNHELVNYEIDAEAVDIIAGGVLPVAWAIAAVFTAAAGGGVVFGYQVGSDRAARDNRND